MSELSRELERLFRCNSGIVAGDLFFLEDREIAYTKKVTEEFKAVFSVVDSFCLHYYESIKSCSIKYYVQWSDYHKTVYAIFTSSFWRYWSAYRLFQMSYSSETISLLRSVFESSMQLSALRNKIIKLKDVYGGDGDEMQDLEDEELYRLLKKKLHSSDNKIRNYLLGNESGLSGENKYYLNVFMDGFNHAVHKSRISFSCLLNRWSSGGGTQPVFPKYDKGIITLASSYLLAVGWLCLKNLPMLHLPMGFFDEEWFRRYEVLDRAMEELVCLGDNPVGKAIAELVSLKFNYPSRHFN